MKQLKEITAGFANAKIAVIGDICLDMYYFLSEEATEVSVETGLRTRSVSDFKHEAGGAGNVAINLITLGASQVDLYGVCGEDPFGRILKRVLEDAGVNISHIHTQDRDWHTQVYHKFYADSIEEPRCDIGNFNNVQTGVVQALLEDLEKNIHNYQVVVINQQVLNGYHNETFQNGLVELIRKYEKSCFWISDCRHLNRVYDRSIRKLNIHEARTVFRDFHDTELPMPGNRELALWLFSHWKKPVIITLGPDGALAVDNDGSFLQAAGINLIGRLDTVGAGDAFLSGLALTLASGASLKEALEIGNFSANVSVTKLFETGHPTLEEVLEMGVAPDYRYHPELADDVRRAVYVEGADIELIDLPALKKAGRPKIVIFDHDGTISTLRQGWEPIMKKMVVSAIFGEYLEKAPQAEIERVESAAEEMIEKTTGVQTITQMHHLCDLIRSFGFVPDESILKPTEYKEIYNDELISMVARRIELYRRGLLDLGDVTLKGSVQFLRELRESGVTMYLASGTDQEDVRREAEVLGYAEYFEGRIYGSIGNPALDPKRVVIAKIVDGLPKDVRPEECCVFGDGPVEIREATRRNFSRIGLISDEKQRFGVNPDKRSRLILAGAQALIPDFSWRDILMKHLGWER